MGSREVVWAGREHALGASERWLAAAACAPDPTVAAAALERLVAELGGPDEAARSLSTGPARRLLPLLAERADQLGLADPLRRAAQDAAAEAWGLNERLLAAVRPVLERFAAERIDALALKGLGLLGAAYPLHRLRPLGDADLLVRPRDARRAVALLDDLGWRVRRPRRLPVTGGTALAAIDPVGPSVDLHWWPGRTMPHRWRGEPACWAAAVPAGSDHPLAGTGLLVPAAADHLVILAVHRASTYAAPTAHPWADAHRLLAGGIDPVALAAAARAEGAIERTAELVRDVAAIVDQPELAELAPAATPAERRAEQRVRDAEAADARRPGGWRGAIAHRRLRWIAASGGLGPVDSAAVLLSQLTASAATGERRR